MTTKAPTAATRRNVTERVTALSREARPSLLAFMLAGFWKLPALPAATIKDAASRTYYHGDAGWIVPVDSLGRKGRDTLATEKGARTTAESIRIWINKHLADVVPSNNVAVVIELVDDQYEVVIYRKA
jgi:hypothetical protein